MEQAETRETNDHSGVADELLSQFKIVTFDNLEDDEIETGRFWLENISCQDLQCYSVHCEQLIELLLILT